jgi:hypothetical protein
MKNAQSKVIDLKGEVDRLDDEIEDLLDEAEDLDPDTEKYEEVEVQYQALRVQKEKYASIVDERGSTFEIEELSFGTISHIRDDVMAHSDGDNPREGLYKVKVLSAGVVDSPAGFDDDPKEWPPVVAEWVYDEIESLNTGIDEENLGRYSMDEALSQRDQSE